MARTIAIPSSGVTLDAVSDIAVPHALYFILVDPADGSIEAHVNPGSQAGAHPGIVTAKFLIEHGVTDVLGHHMGHHPAAALAQKGIRVHEGRPGATGQQLLELFRSGALAVLGEAEINARHGAGHGHHSH